MVGLSHEIVGRLLSRKATRIDLSLNLCQRLQMAILGL
jgi:hypothetical protein